MGLFPHECRPPVPWFFTRTWTCHCGQQFVVRPINRQTPDGQAIAEAVPTGKVEKR
jgi:hypothetical protein